jgi:hypothetical protein
MSGSCKRHCGEKEKIDESHDTPDENVLFQQMDMMNAAMGKFDKVRDDYVREQYGLSDVNPSLVYSMKQHIQRKAKKDARNNITNCYSGIKMLYDRHVLLVLGFTREQIIEIMQRVAIWLPQRYEWITNQIQERYSFESEIPVHDTLYAHSIIEINAVCSKKCVMEAIDSSMFLYGCYTHGKVHICLADQTTCIYDEPNGQRLVCAYSGSEFADIHTSERSFDIRKDYNNCGGLKIGGIPSSEDADELVMGHGEYEDLDLLYFSSEEQEAYEDKKASSGKVTKRVKRENGKKTKAAITKDSIYAKISDRDINKALVRSAIVNGSGCVDVGEAINILIMKFFRNVAFGKGYDMESEDISSLDEKMVSKLMRGQMSAICKDTSAGFAKNPFCGTHSKKSKNLRGGVGNILSLDTGAKYSSGKGLYVTQNVLTESTGAVKTTDDIGDGKNDNKNGNEIDRHAWYLEGKGIEDAASPYTQVKEEIELWNQAIEGYVLPNEESILSHSTVGVYTSHGDAGGTDNDAFTFTNPRSLVHSSSYEKGGIGSYPDRLAYVEQTPLITPSHMNFSPSPHIASMLLHSSRQRNSGTPVRPSIFGRSLTPISGVIGRGGDGNGRGTPYMSGCSGVDGAILDEEFEALASGKVHILPNLADSIKSSGSHSESSGISSNGPYGENIGGGSSGVPILDNASRYDRRRRSSSLPSFGKPTKRGRKNFRYIPSYLKGRYTENDDEEEYRNKELVPKLKRSVRSKREERKILGEEENDKKRRRLQEARIHENQYYYVKNDAKGGYDRLPTNSILMGSTADMLMGNPNQFDLKTVLETSKLPEDIDSHKLGKFGNNDGASSCTDSRFLTKKKEIIVGNLLCARKASRNVPEKLSAKLEIGDDIPVPHKHKNISERTEERFAEKTKEDKMYKLLLKKIKKTTLSRNTNAKVLKHKVEHLMYDIIFNVDKRRNIQHAYTVVALVNTREEIKEYLNQIQKTLDFQKSVMVSTKGICKKVPYSYPISTGVSTSSEGVDIKGKDMHEKDSDKGCDEESNSIILSSAETIELKCPKLSDIDDLYGKYLSDNIIPIIQHDKERTEKYCEMIYRVWELLLCCENVIHDKKASSQFDKFALGFLYVLSEGDVVITNHRTEETIVLLKKDEWLKYALPSKSVLRDTHNNKFRKREVANILSANMSFSYESLQFSTKSNVYSSRSVSSCCERVRKMLSNYKWYAEDKTLLQRYVSEFQKVQYIPLKKSTYPRRFRKAGDV